MKKLSRLLLIICTVTIISCINQKGYIITGYLTGFPDSTKFYLQNLSTQETFDSTLIIKNKLAFRGKLQNVPEQIWLNSRVDNQFIYANLLIGNENVNIKGDIKDFPWDVKISGSRTQDDYNYRLNLTKAFYIKRDSLVKSYLKLSPDIQEEKGKEIWDKIKILDDTTHSIIISYVKSHLNTYPGIIDLGYLTKSFTKDTLKAIYGRLSPEIKSSRFAKIIEIYLSDKISEIGDIYHDFEAINRVGEKIKFSELTGKYILLDFTSANCGPCVQSAEELRLIDKTYNDSLSIISFSTDAKKDIWINSLKQDSISWISLWDGKGTFSETYIKYGVQGIPAFFLIAPNGKIIDKWVGYGKGSLENKLKKFKNI
jgi:peroxiredoxin